MVVCVKKPYYFYWVIRSSSQQIENWHEEYKTQLQYKNNLHCSLCEGGAPVVTKGIQTGHLFKLEQG